MLFATKSATDKRADFRKALDSGKLLCFPGAFSPLVALEVERHGFDGIYISGAALSAELALPDVGLTTLSEVAQRGRQIARVTRLPAIIDVDTGFGEAMNAARTIQEMEEMGICGCHLEDQVNPKGPNVRDDTGRTAQALSRLNDEDTLGVFGSKSSPPS